MPSVSKTRVPTTPRSKLPSATPRTICCSASGAKSPTPKRHVDLTLPFDVLQHARAVRSTARVVAGLAVHGRHPKDDGFRADRRPCSHLGATADADNGEENRVEPLRSESWRLPREYCASCADGALVGKTCHDGHHLGRPGGPRWPASRSATEGMPRLGTRPGRCVTWWSCDPSTLIDQRSTRPGPSVPLLKRI